MDLQDPRKKMSKSEQSPAGVILLLDDPADIERKIKRAVTDTESEVRFDPEAKPGVSNLLAILSSVGGESVADLEARFEGSGYGDLKKGVVEAVLDFALPFQERVRGFLDDPATLDSVLSRGAERAREVAAGTLASAYENIGFLPAGEGH
jgi:tryptophanyl-tRNA synthetase